jgi:hypothetical protein
MKNFLLLLMVLGFVIQSPAQDAPFIVAVKAVQNPKSNEPAWRIDIGEVYKFVRYVSRTEYQGLAPDANDKTYAMVQMDKVTVIAPADTFAAVPEKDLAQAAMKYGAQVTQNNQPTLPQSATRQPGRRPLPRNWIDPAQADANFAAEAQARRQQSANMEQQMRLDALERDQRALERKLH